MNKYITLILTVVWSMLTMIFFWSYYPDIRQSITTLDPFWSILCIVSFLFLIGYIVYTMFSLKEKVKYLSFRPGIFLLFILGLPPLFFFIEYTHVLGFYTAVFESLHLPEANASVQLAKQLGIAKSELLDSGRVAGAFFLLYGKALLALAGLFFTSLGIGVCVRSLLPTFSYGERLFLQLVSGVVLLILLLFAVGYFGVFRWDILVGSMLIFSCVAFLVEGKEMWKFLTEKKHIELSPLGILTTYLSIPILLLVYVTGFLHVLRPIPIGWDDITLYMNLPSLTTQYGSLVSGYSTYNWGLVMAMGFTVFGSATFAMLYSFVGSLLAFFGITILLKRFLPKENKSGLAVFFSTAFVLSPFVQFQTSEDMKVDLALTGIGAGVMLLLAELFGEGERKHEFTYVGMIGSMLGVMLGIKFTALLFLFFVALLLAWKYGRGWMMGGVVSFFAAFVFAANTIRYGGITLVPEVRMQIAQIVAVIGVVCVAFSIFHSKGKKAVLVLVQLGCMAFLTFVPWLIFEGQSTCIPKQACALPSFDMFLTGQGHTPVLVPKIAGSGSTIASEQTTLRKEFETQIALPASTNSEYFSRLKDFFTTEGRGEVEELQRYRGYNKGLLSYLGLPFSTTFGLNEHGDYITIGWMFLGFLPLLLFVPYIIGKGKEDWFFFSLALSIFLLGILILFAVVNTWDAKIQQEIFGVGIQDVRVIFIVTFLAFSLVGTCLMRMRSEDGFGGILMLSTILYWFAWSYLASGVIWYGILGFLPLLILLGRAFSALEEEYMDWVWVFVSILIMGWMLPMTFYKLAGNDVQVPVLQNNLELLFEGCTGASQDGGKLKAFVRDIQLNVRNEKDQEAVAMGCVDLRQEKITEMQYKAILKEHTSQVSFEVYKMPDSLSFLLFKAGILTTAEETLRQMNPPYADAISIIKDSPIDTKIYRVGTFIPYYTPHNDQRLIHDNQLDIFISYYLPEMDKKAFLKVLKDSHVGYIVYDNNTESIDKTSKQTLKKKVELFKGFMENNPDLTLMVGKGNSSDAVRVYKIK